VRDRKARPFRFFDDGAVPNHPRWPLLHYRGPIRLAGAFDPAAVFEVLFERNGWADSWSASNDFLVVGAYPASGTYDLCHTSPDEHDRPLFPKCHRRAGTRLTARTASCCGSGAECRAATPGARARNAASCPGVPPEQLSSLGGN
jgi:hypothetical protein